ncbi:hypothetical protein [Halarcobacter ebronensis]|uniref:Uncharacterized protein n=1 Tax=Halarcobacter ebronensis TaxID=1462615 RepID=A0A4Q1ALU1_9BACT|nr:hypothetical protein [Halarcobacter ebronensis]QKF81032.1 hypothetical protein AEBR_0524 [Halarcobacter ebronensis]RXK06342.1 hypothetical protein CRV07_06510 [Halarcobacter ebronensis]
MEKIPEILNNPINPSFNLAEMEIYNLKEALELIELEKLSFSIFVIWQCAISNLQRRVETFNIETFLNTNKNRELYNKSASSLKERWQNINEYEIIEFCEKSSIITKVSAHIIRTLYWMKFSTENEKIFTKNEIFSLLYLLEQNLFLSKFKIDKRENVLESSTEFKRRKEDENNEIKNATTHQELVLKNGMREFQNTLLTNNKNDTLLTAYI